MGVCPQFEEYNLQMVRKVDGESLNREAVVEANSNTPKGTLSFVTPIPLGVATYLSKELRKASVVAMMSGL